MEIFKQALSESISTQLELTDDEKKFIMDNSFTNDEKCEINDSNIRIILLTNKMIYHGKIARYFNRTLKNIAEEKSIERLDNLYKLSLDDSIPEIFKNNMLDNNQIKTVSDKLSFEHSILTKAIELYEKEKKMYIMPYNFNKINTLKYESGNYFKIAHKFLCIVHKKPEEIDSYLFPTEYIIPTDDGIIKIDSDELINNMINDIYDSRFSQYQIDNIKKFLEIELIAGKFDLNDSVKRNEKTGMTPKPRYI